MSIEDRFMFIAKLNEQIVSLILDIPWGPDGADLDPEVSISLQAIDELREQRQNLLDSLDWA